MRRHRFGESISGGASGFSFVSSGSADGLLSGRVAYCQVASADRDGALVAQKYVGQPHNLYILFLFVV